jgi:nitroimidazol reductase NimA-like FMN-containing flavoprotein (pyridoxamine 5'-phosphate oxidase superfamily)
MPGYGTLPPGDGGGLLPWEFAQSRLETAHDYWLATITAGVRPHVMPIWAIWLDEQLWFSSSNGSRKYRNITQNPHVSIATDDPHQPVVLEGSAALVDAAAIARFNDVLNAKYESNYELDFYRESSVFAVTPVTVFALDDDNFLGSPTRWRFGDRSE